jgi:signal transduction histidine kinase
MLVNDRIATEAERRESYGLLFHASERLQRLVESLLDFGRMEAAAFRYHFEEVDVADLVSRTVEEFRRQAAQGYAVELTQADHLPLIRGDREALGVALWNLLDNAVKYSPNHRTIQVETAREGNAIAIAVHDRGLGIDPREQRRIFDKFVRGSVAWKSNIKGTGIGLSMARHIAHAHGGDIRLVSEPGHGSTFTLSIPIEKTT